MHRPIINKLLTKYNINKHVYIKTKKKLNHKQSPSFVLNEDVDFEQIIL